MNTELQSETNISEQDTLYQSYRDEYWADLAHINDVGDELINSALITATEQVTAPIEADRMVQARTNLAEVPNLVRTAFATSADHSSRTLESASEQFYAVATTEDTAVLDEAARVFYHESFDDAFKYIDEHAPTETSRRAMRTAMDRFTFDVLEGMLSKHASNIFTYDSEAMLQIHDFVRNFASSDTAAEAMFMVVNARIASQLFDENKRPSSTVNQQQLRTNYVNKVVFGEQAKQALLLAGDDLTYRAALRLSSEVGEGRDLSRSRAWRNTLVGLTSPNARRLVEDIIDKSLASQNQRPSEVSTEKPVQ